MPITVADILLGVILPTAIAMVILVLFRWAGVLRGGGHGFAIAVAWAAAFLAGYYAQELGPILPTMDREWIPVAAGLALPVSALLCLGKARRWLGLIAAAPAVVALAYVLVPDWESLEENKLLMQFSWGGLTLFLLVVSSWQASARQFASEGPGEQIAAATDSREQVDAVKCDAAKRTVGGVSRQKLLAHLLCVLVMLGVAFPLLALSGSLRFATIALTVLGGGLGVFLAILISGNKDSVQGFGKAFPGLDAVWILVMASTLLTAYINSWSQIPTAIYWLLPVTVPLGSFVWSLSGRLSARRRMVCAVAVCTLACLVLLGFSVAAEWEAITAVEMY